MKSRGVIMILALTVIGLATALMATLAAHARLEITRTTMAAEDAQIGQLLSAGIYAAAADAKNGQFQSRTVPSPIGNLNLSWQAGPRTRAKHCTVEARFGKTSRTASFEYPLGQ